MGNRSLTSHSLSDRIRRLPVMTRFMMLRLLNNDVLHFDRRGRENLVALITVLSVLGGVTAHLLLRLYLFGMVKRPASIWLEETYFLTLFMAAMGILATLIWDGFSLDSRDFNNLLTTPVTPGELIIAKGASLIAFSAVISFVLNVIAAIIFTLYLAKRSELALIRPAAAHLTVAFIAALFILSLVAALQGMMKTSLSPPWYRRLAPLVRSALLALFITPVFWFPTIYPMLSELRDDHSPLFLVYPPLWFTGMYESILDHSKPLYQAQNFMILTALTIGMGIYLLTLPRHLRRHRRRKPGSEAKVNTASRPGVFIRLLETLFLRHPHQKAGFHLARISINRSRRHRRFVAAFILIPLIFIACELLFLFLEHGSDLLEEPNLYMISVSMVFVLFIGLGTRLLITIPFQPAGDRLLQLTGIRDNRRILSGIIRAFYLLVFVPLILFLGSFYVSLWQSRTAIFHMLYSAGILIALVTILFMRFTHIPFFPPADQGSPRGWMWRLLQFAAMLATLAITSTAGLTLARHPEYIVIFYLLLIILILLSRWVTHYDHNELIFTYQRGLHQVIVGLDMDRSRRDSPAG